jgi:RNA polymerase sigma factor (sigma-70 family)
VTDAEVIERSLAFPESFALLFDRHFRSVHRFLRARVGADLADDLAAETFVVAFRRRSAYDRKRADARPWLYGIAVNLLRGHRRDEERRLRAHARAADGERAEVEPGVLDEALAAALLELSVRDRNLILLHAWAGLSYEQLADALRLPLGTVRSAMSRTRARLRSKLEPEASLVGGEELR